MELVLREIENEFQRSNFNPFTPTNCPDSNPPYTLHLILMVWRNCYLNQLIITLLTFLFILTAGLFDTVRGNSVLVTCGN